MTENCEHRIMHADENGRLECAECGYELKIEAVLRDQPTPEQQQGREQFLEHVWNMVNYWDNERSRSVMSTRGALEGLAFSLLVAIDGEAAIPAHALVPISEEGTAHMDNDIAGTLHERFHSKGREMGLVDE